MRALILLYFRGRLGTFLLLAGLAGAWLTAAHGGATRETAFAMSMSIAFLIGPMIAITFPPPEVLYLPISRRDLWKATWLASVLAPAGFMIVIRLLTLLDPATRSTPGLAGITLSPLLDFAYAGSAAVLWILHSLPKPKLGAAGRVVDGLLVTIFIGCTFWPYALRSLRPGRWSELTLGSGIALAAATCVAAAGYFHSPPLTGRKDRWQATGAGAGAGGARFTPSVNRCTLTGLPRLLWNEYLWSLTVGTAICVSFAVVSLFIEKDLGDLAGSPAGFLRRRALLPFEGSFAPVDDNPMILMTWFGFFAMSTVARFGKMMRHLRALPLTAWQLNGLLLSWPVLTWLTVWGALIVAHVVVARTPITSLHPPLLLAAIAASAAVTSFSLRWPAQSKWVLLTGGVVLIPALQMFSRASEGTFAFTGVICLAVAAFVNHSALRRSVTYKPVPPPLAAAGAPR